MVRDTAVVTRRPRPRWLRSPDFVIGIAFLTVFLMLAVLGPVLVPAETNQLNVMQRFKPPSGAHWFGTDAVGRDIFGRVVAGTRISLLVVCIVLPIAVGIGTLLGAIGGYFGGTLDSAIMRVTDVFLAFPGFILAMAVNAVVGPGLTGAMIAIAFVWWPGYARLIRGEVLTLKGTTFVEGARALGGKDVRIVWRHILPQTITPVVVKMTLDVGYIILTTATLSFLGLGAQPPTPEWGAMVNEGRAFIIDYWWWSTFPGLAITVCVIGFNVLGDGLREVLDPHKRL